MIAALALGVLLALFVTVCVVVGLRLTAMISSYAPGPLVIRSRVRQKMLVTLKSGSAFQGVLYAADRQAWVLRNAVGVAAGDNGVNVIVDGEVLILTADIAYAQKL